MPRFFSGKEIARILSSKYGFKEIGISGSHLKMRKEVNGKHVTTIIPLHKEVLIGTFHSILRLAQVNKKDFLRKSKE